MPFINVSIVAPLENQLGAGLAVIESGILTAISIYAVHTPTAYNEHYADFMLCSTLTPNVIRLQLLAKGQFGRDLHFTWRGRILSEPHMAVRIRASSMNPLALRFNAVVQTEII